jgi:hypothetical protein
MEASSRRETTVTLVMSGEEWHKLMVIVGFAIDQFNKLPNGSLSQAHDEFVSQLKDIDNDVIRGGQ